MEFDRSTTYPNRHQKGWGDGPWTTEPDKVQWVDEETDLDCLIVRNYAGALCGYVGVPKEHPWYGIEYDNSVSGKDRETKYEDDNWRMWDSPDYLIQVHGGLTYSARCQENGKICHVPLEGRTDDIWWFGFDCGHFCDLRPRDRELFPDLIHRDEVYRDIDYVVNQVQELAKQLRTYAIQGSREAETGAA